MNKLLKGGLILGLGTIITKVLGAVYRIPLTNFLGAEGIGIYQMVFPFYSILLTLSSTGVPSALSKMIAEGKDSKKLADRSIIAFGSIGFAGSLIMFFCAEVLAKLQGNPSAAMGYKALSPSVFLVSVISVLRGLCQGKSNMAPTAISQVTEQFIKLCAGLVLVYFFGKTAAAGAFFACLAVSLSEAFALILLLVIRKTKFYEQETNGDLVSFREIFRVVIPITLTAIMLPLSRAADSFLVVNIMNGYTSAATKLYGIYTGSVESLIGVPVALCYGIAVACIPIIAKDKHSSSTNKVIIYTAILSLLGGVAIFLLSGFCINLLYYGFSEEEKAIAINLLKISSVSVVLLSLVQSSTSVLIAHDRLYKPCINLGLGLVIKIIMTLILVKIPEINIYGTAFSDIACYFVAAFLNLLYIIREENKSEVTKRLSVNKLSGRKT